MLLWSGQTVSQVGSQVTVLALPLVAIVILKATTFEVGLLSAATTSAYLLVALPVGVLADRVSRRRLMLVSDLAQFAIIGSVPLAYMAGVLTLGQMYAVALIASVFSVLFSVSYTSYLPSVVGEDRLVEANGKLSTTQSVAQIAGPGFGALLVGLLGAALAMTADALSYLVSAACLLTIRSSEPAIAAPSRRQPLRGQIADGLRYVLRDPILRNGVAWSGTANFFVIMVETLGPVFLVRTLHLHPAYVGVLLALGAVGGVGGGMLSGPLSRRFGSARMAWISMTAISLPGLLIPLARPGGWTLLFAVGWISWTFGATICGVALVSYQQATCPPEMRGRVAATARWINWGTLPLGGLACGVLGSVLGVRPTLWLAVIGGCCSGLWLFFSPLRGLRDIPAISAAPA
jgi:MFS family permease